MENFLDGGIRELETVRTAVSELSGKEQAYKEMDRSLKAKQKELEIQRKRVEEKITSSIRKSRTELEKGFDEQLGTAERAIKEAEIRKKNAKAAAVNQRMKRENSSLVDENKVLGAEIKSQFRGESVPGFCNTPLYYSLFKPKKKTDILYCAAGIVLFAGIIPFIVTRFVSSPFWRVVVWIFIILFFAALYFLIASWTKKGERDTVLDRVRPSVDRIAENRKFIRKRNKNIKADPDESQYNLSEYDQEVEAAKSEYESVAAEKEAAIRHFEEVESVDIRERLQEEKAPVFQQLEKEIDQMREELQVRNETYQDASREFEEYAGLLGEKNMKTDRLDELMSLISEGKAANIQEALEAQKNKKQKVWQQTETAEAAATAEDNSIEEDTQQENAQTEEALISPEQDITTQPAPDPILDPAPTIELTLDPILDPAPKVELTLDPVFTPGQMQAPAEGAAEDAEEELP